MSDKSNPRVSHHSGNHNRHWGSLHVLISVPCRALTGAATGGYSGEGGGERERKRKRGFLHLILGVSWDLCIQLMVFLRTQAGWVDGRGLYNPPAHACKTHVRVRAPVRAPVRARVYPERSVNELQVKLAFVFDTTRL